MVGNNKTPKFFKAAVLTELKKPLEILELEIPKLQRGQVLVKVLYSGICRSQVMEIKGGRGEDKWIPHLLGHEGVGEVIDIGSAVSKVRPGDKVILGWLKCDGLNVGGASYNYNGKIINSGPVTTFSEYTIVSENRLIIKPKEIDDSIAVLFGCALPTGSGMILNELKPKKSDFLLILGLGGIGFSALITSLLIGCKNIIAADISDQKLNLAKDLGVNYLINTSNTNLLKEINRITNDKGVDACIESAGKIHTIELGFECVKYGGGILIFASHPEDGKKIKLLPHDLIRGKKIFGSWGGGTIPEKDFPILSSYIVNGNIDLGILVDKRYKLTEINDAIDDLESGKVFRPIIEF